MTWRYQEVVRYVQDCIDSGTVKPGERLQSVREMSAQTGFSVVTVHHAYSLLESEGLIEARPRSGFYVAANARISTEFPNEHGLLKQAPESVSVSSQLYKLMALWRERRIDSFGSLYPSSDLLPTHELLTHMRRYLRNVRPDRPPAPSLAGHPDLLDVIGRRAALRGVRIRGQDTVVTNNSQTALDLCLDVTTRPGDLVLIESPSYFPLFAALQRRHLRAIEIYSHPVTGVDPDQFDYLLDHNDVRACLLMPVNHFPTGVTYPDEVLERLATKSNRSNVPIIEYDAMSELTHSASSPSSLKVYDSQDLVLQVGGFAATLGPLAGAGWVLNARFRESILERMAFSDLAASEAALQQAIAECILRHSYDRQLRNVREQLKTRMRRGLQQIAQSFPAGCSASIPSGGFMCWVRLPAHVDSLRLAETLADEDISILPGPLLSVANSFRNFVGLNLSFKSDGRLGAQIAAVSHRIRTPEGPSDRRT